MSQATDRLRFDTLVTQYAAGSISPEDRSWMNAYVQANPQLNAVLDWHTTLSKQLNQQFAAVPADIGLDKALINIRSLPRKSSQRSQNAEAQIIKPQAQGNQGKGSGQGVMDWLFGGQKILTPAFAILAACAIVPTYLLMQKPAVEHAEVRSIKQGVFDGPLLRVNFKADSKEADLRFLLVEQGGVIVGPTRLGDWFVHVAPTRIDLVRESLSKSALVASVDIVQTLPAELVDQ